MIKAYHQVGSEEWTSEDRISALHEVLQAGKLEPASTRMDRNEMEIECFTGKDRGSTINQKFPRANAKTKQALRELAEEKISKLPVGGMTHGLFNCLDLLAGDLELIFLRPGSWYSFDNGFVFDAEKLLKQGARFRKDDLLGGYRAAIEGVIRSKHESVEIAKEDIELEIGAIQDHFQSTGRTAVRSLKEGFGDRAEIVWRGDLSLDLAIEVWEEGKRVR